MQIFHINDLKKKISSLEKKKENEGVVSLLRIRLAAAEDEIFYKKFGPLLDGDHFSHLVFLSGNY